MKDAWDCLVANCFRKSDLSSEEFSVSNHKADDFYLLFSEWLKQNGTGNFRLMKTWKFLGFLWRCKTKKIVMTPTLCASKTQFLRNPWKCWRIFNIVTVLVFSCTAFNKTDCTDTAKWNLPHRTHSSHIPKNWID